MRSSITDSAWVCWGRGRGGEGALSVSKQAGVRGGRGHARARAAREGGQRQGGGQPGCTQLHPPERPGKRGSCLSSSPNTQPTLHMSRAWVYCSAPSSTSGGLPRVRVWGRELTGAVVAAPRAASLPTPRLRGRAHNPPHAPLARAPHPPHTHIRTAPRISPELEVAVHDPVVVQVSYRRQQLLHEALDFRLVKALGHRVQQPPQVVLLGQGRVGGEEGGAG